jgi:hypothetical protein
VTSVDVNNLIPVVSESLSMSVPSTGTDGLVADPSANVWASGAATAAFDAFDDHVPAVAVDEAHSMAANLVTEPDAEVQSGVDVLADDGVPTLAGADDPSLQFDGPVIDDSPIDDAPAEDNWSHAAPEDQHLEADDSGFDIFE